MKINFFEISEEGLSFSFQSSEWVPGDFVIQGDVVSSLFMKRFSGRIIATGEFAVTVVLACDRCLKEFVCPLSSKFKIDIELPGGDDDIDYTGDHHCNENEMDVFVLDSEEIDLFQLLQQQLYLALDMKNICSLDCKGICKDCGANLNLEACTCVKETHSPFAKLAGLKIK